MTLYTLAYLRAAPTPRQLERLLDGFSTRHEAASGDDLANIIMALVQFDYKPA
jgi:hypothetical protein